MLTIVILSCVLGVYRLNAMLIFSFVILIMCSIDHSPWQMHFAQAFVGFPILSQHSEENLNVLLDILGVFYSQIVG